MWPPGAADGLVASADAADWLGLASGAGVAGKLPQSIRFTAHAKFKISSAIMTNARSGFIARAASSRRLITCAIKWPCRENICRMLPFASLRKSPSAATTAADGMRAGRPDRGHTLQMWPRFSSGGSPESRADLAPRFRQAEGRAPGPHAAAFWVGSGANSSCGRLRRSKVVATADQKSRQSRRRPHEI